MIITSWFTPTNMTPRGQLVTQHLQQAVTWNSCLQFPVLTLTFVAEILRSLHPGLRQQSSSVDRSSDGEHKGQAWPWHFPCSVEDPFQMNLKYRMLQLWRQLLQESSLMPPWWVRGPPEVIAGTRVPLHLDINTSSQLPVYLSVPHPHPPQGLTLQCLPPSGCPTNIWRAHEQINEGGSEPTSLSQV